MRLPSPQAFDYWSALYSETMDAEGEPDVYDITFNSYLDFCR